MTKNSYGKGTAYYFGCMTSAEVITAILRGSLTQAKVEIPAFGFPVIVKKGVNEEGKMVRYYLNYSSEEQKVAYTHEVVWSCLVRLR